MAEAASRDLETKLTQLQITKSKTETMLWSGSVTRIKRHKDSLHAIIATVEKSKRKVEEIKIASGEEIATINAWCDEVEEELTAVDKGMDTMAKYLSEMNQEQVEKSRREQLAFEKELFGQKLKFNQELGQGKSSSNTNQNTSHVESQEQAVAKLPKLRITMFNGTNLIGQDSGANLPKELISLTWLQSRNSPT